MRLKPLFPEAVEGLSFGAKRNSASPGVALGSIGLRVWGLGFRV